MISGESDRYYSGKGCYRHVEKLIRQGKEVCIISPYIDRYYAAFLRRQAGRKRIYVIASSLGPDAQKVLSGGRPPWFAITFTLVLILLNYIAFMLRYDSAYLVSVSAVAIVISFAAFASGEPGRIRLKQPREFVHAKMYISEELAIEGSANLTYKGMHGNVEHISITADKRRIGLLRKQFWGIWRSF